MSAITVGAYNILRELAKLRDEKHFRTLLVNFFNNIDDTHAIDTHGTDERGVDIEVTFDGDLIKRQYVMFVQAKVGDVGITEWRRNLCAQLSNLVYRRPIENKLSMTLPRRILFMTTGTIANKVHEEITDWNTKVPVPIESFDGRETARLLAHYEYEAKDIPTLGRKIKVKKVVSISKPKGPLPISKTVPSTQPAEEQVRIGKTGSPDFSKPR